MFRACAVKILAALGFLLQSFRGDAGRSPLEGLRDSAMAGRVESKFLLGLNR